MQACRRIVGLYSTAAKVTNNQSAGRCSVVGRHDRRGDQEMLKQLIAEKLDIDRKLREH